MQRIAVAGASGVLGRALVPLLLEAGYAVRALTPSRRPRPPVWRRRGRRCWSAICSLCSVAGC